jgi:alcohol dehydrogenase
MRAVVYEAFGRVPTVEMVPDPTPPPLGAVVRVEASGLCRSDWHGWIGHDPDIRHFPHVPGHELAGVVEAVGTGGGGPASA